MRIPGKKERKRAVSPARYTTEFERALESYQMTFGDIYPYISLNLTAKEAIADIRRRVREKIPVPTELVEYNAPWPWAARQ